MWSDSHCSLFFTSYIWFSNLVPQFFLFNVSNVSQEINDAHKYLIYWVLPHNWWLTHIALTSYSHPPRTAICAICGLAEARNERAVIPSPTALRLTRNEITARISLHLSPSRGDGLSGGRTWNTLSVPVSSFSKPSFSKKTPKDLEFSDILPIFATETKD